MNPEAKQPPTRVVLLASPRAFCAGVERAIQTVESVLDQAKGPVYVRKQIVHNSSVVADLESRGAVFVNELDEIPDPPPPGTVVIFSAHGVSPAVRLTHLLGGRHYSVDAEPVAREERRAPMSGLGYTLPAVLAVIAVCVLEIRVWRTGLFRRPAYWISMAIVVGFQIPVDGWLTKLSAPIVLYDEQHTSGIRFPLDIPIEDFLFGFALVTAVLLLWERRRPRTEVSKQR